jgi:hypothetical protein
LTLIAETEGVSLNQFIVSALAEKVGAFTLYDQLTKKLDKKMSKVAINSAGNTFITYQANRTSSDAMLIQHIEMKEAEPYAGDKKYIVYS